MRDALHIVVQCAVSITFLGNQYTPLLEKDLQ